jgi:hypothetical protein
MSKIDKLYEAALNATAKGTTPKAKKSKTKKSKGKKRPLPGFAHDATPAEKRAGKAIGKKNERALKAPKKVVEVDWDDEDSVKLAMAQALEVDANDLKIKEDHGYSGFGAGTVYLVEMGKQEYHVAENSDVAHDLAVAVVKQDLEHEPEIFNQDFIASHIDLDRLRNDLMSDVQNMRYEDLKEEADKRPERFIKDNDLEWPEPTEKQLRDHAEAMSDETHSAQSIYDKLKSLGDAEDRWTELGEEPEINDSEIETLAEQQAKDQLKDPLEYLKDIYGDEATKKAIEIVGIDEDAAADEAVSTDGEGHFLARYDGNMHDGPGGIVYWRSN